jgi:O-antigen/teichoic acid export membrane protein
VFLEVKAADRAGEEYSASLGRRLAGAIAAVASGSVTARVFGFASNVVAARAIGVVGFGMLGVVRSTLSAATSLTSLGVGAMAARYIPRWRNSRPEAVAQIVALAAVVGLGGVLVTAGSLYLLAPKLAREVFRIPSLIPLLRAAIPWVAALLVTNMVTEVLRGYERFGALASVDAGRGVLTLAVLAPVLLAWQKTVLAAILALGAVEIVTMAVLLFVLWHEIARNGATRRLTWLSARLLAGPVRAFAVPSYCFVLLQAPLSWLLLTQLARVDGGSAYVGAVQATASFRNALALVPAALAATLVPLLSHLHSLVSTDMFGSRVRGLVRVLWFFAIPAGALLAGALPFLMELVFGSSYAALAPPCAGLVLVTAWSIVNECFDRTLAAMGKMWLSFWLGLGYAVAATALTFLLVPRTGLWGYVAAQLGAMICYVVAQQEYIGARVGYRLGDRWRALGLAVVGAGAAMGMAGLATGPKTLVAASGLALLLSLAAWRWILRSPERKFIRGRAKSWSRIAFGGDAA